MRTSADVTDQLRQDILGSVFTPGERLIELQLSETYGVGRAAIRSALVELDKEGLVERSTNRGATVRRVPLSEAIQLTEARQALESLAAACAAANASQEARVELQELAVEMRSAVESENYVYYSELNGVLHRRLCEESGHKIAAELIANLKARASHHEFRLALRPGRPAESLPQHEAIIAAVVAGNSDAARAAMNSHLESVIATLQDWQTIGVSPH